MARGTSYYVDVSHDGLNKFRHISGPDRAVVEEKARRQMAVWDEMWDRRQAAEAKREAHEATAQEAAERTEEAREALAAIENLLRDALNRDPAFAWSSLKRKGGFRVAKPDEPILAEAPVKPEADDPEFRPSLGLLGHLILAVKVRREQEAFALYQEARDSWEEQVARVQAANHDAQESYQRACEKWESDRRAFDEERAAHNEAVDRRRAMYESGSAEAIQDYCDLVLSSSSRYPDSFPSEFTVEYRPEGKVVLVDRQLPAPEALPRLREVKYVRARSVLAESFLPQAALNRLYDSCLYQMALRTIHELMAADTINAVEIVVFNGWVRSIDKGSGNETSGCILSLQTTKREFMAINLAQVDPKACFRSLRGVGSAQLHGLTPVQPILQLSRDDGRFVDARSVAEGLTAGDNLAAMDWEDFEHLIREVFEQEFAGGGGEVKITRASRDRGVDAVAFDPDPIRGGKIVIQAKRYTNTVGVSAVRDLYGTVMNEGAMKGILVATSDYGPDAYEFARGKPLTLLSGANLLHMLERHGHKARIDLQEARALQVSRAEQAEG